MKLTFDFKRIAAILLMFVLSSQFGITGQALSGSVENTANLAGDWQITVPGSERTWSLEIEQDVEKLTGQVNLPDGLFDILDGRIRGTEFRFHILDACGNPRSVSGHVDDERMEGTLHALDGPPMSWTAVREDE